MKKILVGFGTTAIITILFFSILGFTNYQVPAKSSEEKLKTEEVVIEKVVEKETDAKTLLKAFTASKGNLVGTNLNYWSQIKDGDYTQGEMEEIALDFAKKLGLEKDAEIFLENEFRYNKVMVTNQDEDEEILITIVMESFKIEDHPAECYLLVDLNLGEKHKDSSQYERMIKEYFKSQNFDYEYSMTLIGTFPEKMNIDSMKDTIEHTFEAIEGQVIEGIEESEYGDMVSLSGYSPNLQNNIQLAGERMNINAAMRYSEYDESTYLWIGTPLIATEY